MSNILYDYKQVVKNGLNKSIDIDITILSIMEHFKIGRNEILSWPADFFELAISKLNIDGKIREEEGKH